jgi:hypothetical protein
MYYILILFILILGVIFIFSRYEFFYEFTSKCNFDDDNLIVEQCIYNHSKDPFYKFKNCLKKNNCSRKILSDLNALNFLSLISNSSCENIKNIVGSIHARE